MQLNDPNDENKDKIERFAALLKGSIEQLVQAGELLVEMLAEDSNAINVILDKHPWIPHNVLFGLESVGRHMLSPHLLLSDAPGVMRLRRLPISQQEKYVQEPVVLLVVKDGRTDSLNVPVKDLTSAQAAQVFAKDHVRDLPGQRAYLLDKGSSHSFPALETKLPYRIKNGAVQFRLGCTVTAKQLVEILAQLK